MERNDLKKYIYMLLVFVIGMAAAVFCKAKITDFSGLVFGSMLWIISVVSVSLGICIGKKYGLKSKDNGKALNKKFREAISAFLILVTFVLSFKLPVAVFISLGLTGFCIGSCRGIEAASHKEKALLYIFSVIFALLGFMVIPSLGFTELLFTPQGGQGVHMFFSAVFVLLFGQAAAMLYSTDESNGKTNISPFYSVYSALFDGAVIFIMSASLEVLAKLFFDDLSIREAFFEFLGSKTILLSLLLLGLIYLAIKNLLGAVLGRAAAIAVFLVFFIGNIVKLKYHDTALLPMDFLQLEDFFGIVFVYVPEVVFILLVALIILGVIALIFVNRKRLSKYKPNLFLSLACVLMIVLVSGLINSNAFTDLGFDVTDIQLLTKDNINRDGLMTFSYIKFKELSNLYPSPEKYYSRDYMDGLEAEFDSLDKGNVSDIRPDVILIMEESMFDAGKLPDVDFSVPVDENMLKYKKADTISPKYGGGTASVEFEGLTGMSNFFLLDNIVPYVTYWQDKKNYYIPSLAHEFNNNGYSTVAIHPNDGAYYDRKYIYKYMGFDRFVDKDQIDFSPENLADDGWFRDDPLADIIKDEMEKSDEPKFIFTVTVENHTLYQSKYDETEVKVSSDKLSKGRLHQLEQYSQGVLDADRFIKKMVDIVDNAKRPTIMYIWGDHLPGLGAFNTLGFIDDKYNKYSTPLIAYSNFKELEIGQEYITPNQIAPQVLRDAEVPHSSYFDFVYSLRKDFPVIHKEFGIDINNEEIRKYKDVQYDLLFGKQYLVSDYYIQ